MCQYLNFFSFKRTAKTDITVYKVLRKCMKGNDKYDEPMVQYRSPIKLMIYNLFALYTATIVRNRNTVDAGLHSFVDEASAKEYINRNFLPYNHVVAKGIIPKGGKYYKSKQMLCGSEIDVYYVGGYVSDSLILTEILSTNAPSEPVDYKFLSHYVE